MSTLSQFMGGGATTSVINAHSSGGTAVAINLSASVNNGLREVLSGALTANTLATVLSVTGGGVIPALTAYAKDSTARTVRLKVTVDGTSVFDATSSSVSAAGQGIFAAGSIENTGSFRQGEPIRFLTSLLVEVASSLTETDKLAIGYTLLRT